MLPQASSYHRYYNQLMNLKTRQLTKSEAIQAMSEDIPVKTNRFESGHHIPFSSQMENLIGSEGFIDGMENRTLSVVAVRVHGYWWNLEAITLA